MATNKAKQTQTHLHNYLHQYNNNSIEENNNNTNNNGADDDNNKKPWKTFFWKLF